MHKHFITFLGGQVNLALADIGVARIFSGGALFFPRKSWRPF